MEEELKAARKQITDLLTSQGKLQTQVGDLLEQLKAQHAGGASSSAHKPPEHKNPGGATENKAASALDAEWELAGPNGKPLRKDKQGKDKSHKGQESQAGASSSGPKGGTHRTPWRPFSAALNCPPAQGKLRGPHWSRRRSNRTA